jgi:hypothetical protein
MLKVVMAKGRRLKKGGGDLENHKYLLLHQNRQLVSKMLFHQF